MKIKYIIETISSKPDPNGNCYHYARVTSTETGKSMLFNSNGPSNARALVQEHTGIEHGEYHDTEGELIMFVIVNNDRNSINYRCFVQHTGNGTNYSPEFHDAQKFDSYEQAHAKALPHERVVPIHQLMHMNLGRDVVYVNEQTMGISDYRYH